MNKRSNLEVLLEEVDEGRITVAAANIMAHLDGKEYAHYSGEEIRAWIERLNRKGLRALRKIALMFGDPEPATPEEVEMLEAGGLQ
jgi:hypothetical protein